MALVMRKTANTAVNRDWLTAAFVRFQAARYLGR